MTMTHKSAVALLGLTCAKTRFWGPKIVCRNLQADEEGGGEAAVSPPPLIFLLQKATPDTCGGKLVSKRGSLNASLASSPVYLVVKVGGSVHQSGKERLGSHLIVRVLRHAV